jgi:hypothetical protein
MGSVQSSIRAKVSQGEFPAPMGAEVFTAYAIASAKELSPEMENAARLTLDYPMTFEFLGEGLRLFEGWALRDLVNFRKRCRDSFIACLDSFMNVQPSVPNIWVDCPDIASTPQQNRVLPIWITNLLLQNKLALTRQDFTHPLDIRSRIRQKYSEALQHHATCHYCLKVHIGSGSTFCAVLENTLAEAQGKVTHSLLSLTTRFTSHWYAVIPALSLA